MYAVLSLSYASSRDKRRPEPENASRPTMTWMAGSPSIISAMFVSQSGAGAVSESVKAMISPRALAIPVLRAA